MAVCIGPVDILLHIVGAKPGLALAVFAAYTVLGTALITNYALAHESEIPIRSARHRDHHA